MCWGYYRTHLSPPPPVSVPGLLSDKRSILLQFLLSSCLSVPSAFTRHTGVCHNRVSSSTTEITRWRRRHVPSVGELTCFVPEVTVGQSGNEEVLCVLKTRRTQVFKSIAYSHSQKKNNYQWHLDTFKTEPQAVVFQWEHMDFQNPQNTNSAVSKQRSIPWPRRLQR